MMVMLKMTRKVLAWSLAGIMLTLAISLITIRVDAQGDMSRVIYSGGDLTSVYWSTDSGRLVLVPRDVPAPTTTSKNILYDIQLQTSDELVEWGLQPELTPTEESTFAPGNNFMFVSPDGNLIAYVKPTTLGESSGLLAIAARNTGTVVTTDIRIRNAFTTNEFLVMWSANSTSFVVNLDLGSDVSLVYHVANADTNSPTVTKLADITTGGETYPWYFLVLLHDISDDGSAVLLRMIKLDSSAADPYAQDAQLVVWTPDSPSNIKVIPNVDAKQVATAAFIGDSSENLVLLDNNGLSTYIWQTNTYATITTAYNAAGYDYFSPFGPYKRAYFSPNAKWMVLLDTRTPTNNLPDDLKVTLIDLAGYNLGTAGLQLASICSPDPATYRTWRIRNSNPERMDFGWTLVGGGLDLQGYGVVSPAGAQPGEVFLSTPTISGDNTLQVSVNGIDQGSITGTATQCASQTAPSTNLDLFSFCSPISAGYRLWSVRNPNEDELVFTWEADASTQKGSGIVPAGTEGEPSETTFITRPEVGDPSVSIFVDEELQQTTLDAGEQCGLSVAKIQYYPESTTRTQYVESIIPQINIVNTDITPVPLSELKVRYYFTKDSATQDLEGVCAWTALPNECDDVVVTTGTLITPVTGADSYIEITFTDGIIDASSETLDIIVRANKLDWSDFDQSDDYSFDPESTSDTWVDWTNVTLYRNDVLIWGEEPQ